MFKGSNLLVLVGIVLLISALVILLEWHAVHSLGFPHNANGDGTEGVQARGADDLHFAAEEVVRNGAQLRGAARAAGGGVTTAPSLQPSSTLPSFPTPPEMRDRACLPRKYDLQTLPKVSLIIPYLNETWRHISATVGSMLAYTPMVVVDQMLFIDDGNAPEWQFHKELLALHPKIRVHRNEQRQGLIRSKVIGAGLVTTEVIFFMEPHCVVQKQWLEPLLQRLMLDTSSHSTIVMPTLDIIPENNFEEYRPANHHIGGFDYSLTFNWMALIEQRNRSYKYPDPYPTPALSGGVFGIWRDYWEKQGTYDTNMSEWGGEHIEMSLRTWRCGGRIEVIPCSRMGHVFRGKNPYVVHPVEVVRNQKRAALVWLDEHLEDFYAQVPMARNLNAGDVTERLNLKERLHCESMDWYVEHVYPELKGKQPRKR